jgi:hypothetical protein
LLLKVQAEGMYQYVAQLGKDREDKVWGVAGGVRLEAGPLRLGLSAYHGKGLGSYVALQNAPSSFDQVYRDLRTFTGVYAQLALVLGREQISAGIGRVLDHQLESDKNGHLVFDDMGQPVIDPATGQQALDLNPAAGVSNLKYQTGISAAFYHHVSDNLVLGFDYFLFRTDWWGARNSMLDANGAIVLLPGYLPGEKQTVHFFNLGATFVW